MRFVTIRAVRFFIAIAACAVNCGFSNAQDSSPAKENHASISPDKEWEYKCAPYYDDECASQLVKTGTTDVVVDLKQDLEMSASESSGAQMFWAPDSKRFAFNYSPVHAHHMVFESVAFYQLREGKWIQLRSPAEDVKQNQLTEIGKGHLPKGFNPHNCAPDRDVVKAHNWIDADTVILYALCYGRTSEQLNAGFRFTLKFDDVGTWKIVKMSQLSKKELKAEKDMER
jgi:hypothetical protein